MNQLPDGLQAKGIDASRGVNQNPALLLALRTLRRQVKAEVSRIGERRSTSNNFSVASRSLDAIDLRHARDPRFAHFSADLGHYVRWAYGALREI